MKELSGSSTMTGPGSGLRISAAIPERVGPYRIEDRIGVGGMGEVYRAFDRRLHRQVAVKQILDTGNANVRRRFRREARAVASLNHAAIVQIYDIIEGTDGDWIVMELVEGETVRKMMSHGRLPVDLIVRLGRQVADGLAAAHAKGIVHRDLKVENVMVTHRHQNAKILDFGLAKRLEERVADETTLSGEGIVVGTFRAMSPEQISGREIDSRSDLFSLGSMLYEMVTGVAPFRADNVVATMTRVCELPHKPIRILNPSVDPELVEIVDHLLEKDADNRPQRAEEVVRRLDRILGDTTTTMSTLSVLTALSEPSVADAVPHPREVTPTVAFPPVAGTTLGSPAAGAPAAGAPADGTSGTAPTAVDMGTSQGVTIKTLVATDLAERRELTWRLGPERSHHILARHDRLILDLLAKHMGQETERPDVFLFERPGSALSFALEYHRRSADLALEEGVSFAVRTGVHLGEVFLRPTRGDMEGDTQVVEGLAKLVARRVLSIARDDQILFTQPVGEQVQRHQVEETAGESIAWVAYGTYQLAGFAEPVEVSEVGATHRAPLRRPANSERGRRVAAGPSLRWPAAVVLLALLALLATAALRLASGRRPEPAGRRPVVAVVGLVNLEDTSSPDNAELSLILTELYNRQLAAGGKLRVIPQERVAQMRRDLGVPAFKSLATDTLERIRTYLGCDFVVGGSWVSYRGTLSVNAQVQTTTGERDEDFVAQARGEPSAVFELVLKTGHDIRDGLGAGRLTEAQQTALRATLPASDPARRSYVRGLARQRRHDDLGARRALEQAIAEDPYFPLAHAALAEVLAALGQVEAARAGAARAVELADPLAQEERLRLRGLEAMIDEDWKRAGTVYEALWDSHPDDVEAGLRLVDAQLAGGRIQAALLTAADLAAVPSAGADPRIALAEASVHLAAGEPALALGACETAATGAEKMTAAGLLAEARLLAGHASLALHAPTAAAAALTEARRLFAETGDTVKTARALRLLAEIRAGAGDPEAAADLLREAAERLRASGHEGELATVLAVASTLGLEIGDDL